MTTQNFVNSLKKSPRREGIFNPWFDHDELHDATKQAPQIRRQQLQAYLDERVGKASRLLLGEALGYQGGHFSGIAMMSERILLGAHEAKGIQSKFVFSKMTPRRTSREDVRPTGFSEPTATVVWQTMLDLGCDPYSFVIWNAFPWHPYKIEKGYLSNYLPKPDEFILGLPHLKNLIELFQFKEIIAIGRSAHAQLERLGIQTKAVRHPANGGVPEFRRQMKDLLSK